MFDRFRSEYAPLRDPSPTGHRAWRDARLTQIKGYIDFANEFAGASFCGGLYRVHDDQTGPLALSLVADAFPDSATMSIPFGYDWLGRQFAIDLVRTRSGQPHVLMFDNGTGEVLEQPQSFASFHNDCLVDNANGTLAAQFFAEWSAANADLLPLKREECVAYKHSLLAGGEDSIENLEVVSIRVCWWYFAQLLQRLKEIPPGSRVVGVKYESGESN